MRMKDNKNEMNKIETHKNIDLNIVKMTLTRTEGHE